MRNQLRHCCLFILLAVVNAVAGSTSTQSAELVFVYLHGFGGEKQDPQFYVNMQAFLQEAKAPARAENYVWDSVRIEPLKAGSNWREAEERADEESNCFVTNVIDRYEQAETPYVLIGFSVGSRVLLRSMEARKGRLKHLQGVYFLGSAMTSETSLPDGVLPAGMKVINYHSPLRDKVHKTAFYFMNGLPAGGEVGFDDTAVFDNYAVSCTHTHKGVGVHIDYSQLAVPIAYAELYEKGFVIPGELSLNLEAKTGKGKVWWNKVLRVSAQYQGKQVPVVIEQSSASASYFRALMITEKGKRKRIARGDNLHAILSFLKVNPKTDMHQPEAD